MAAIALALAVVAVAMGFVAAGANRAAAAQPEINTAGWSTDGVVWDMVRIADTVYIGGEFSQIRDEQGNVSARSNLAAFDVSTGAPLPWAPVVDNEVKAMETSTDGRRVYIGGDFHRVNGRYRQRMAAVDAVTGSTVSGFRANTSGRVLELLVVDDHLYLAGELITVDGRRRDRIARVDSGSGALDLDWSPSVTGGSVRGLEASPNRQRLYVGGTFDAVERVARTAHLAAIDLTAEQPGDVVDRSWRPDLDQPVFDIVATGDSVYLAVAGPGFENNRLQKLSATTGSEQLRYLADGDVQDLELHGTTLFVGGHFEQIFGGLDRSQLAAIDITDGHITDLAPEVVTRYGVWKALAGPEGLWLGGEFTEIDGRPRRGYGFINAETPPPTGTLLVQRGGLWRYDDSGTEPTVGTGWARPDFDDRDWKQGRGQLGFGDGDERTVVASTDALYARSTVNIADPGAYDDYTIRVLADAGAAVYVNGVEVGRDNLPAGPLDGETLAIEGRWTTGERTFTKHTVDRARFRSGANTIAVEVHGAYDQPGDLSFDLELIGVDRGLAPGDQPGDPDDDPVDPGDRIETTTAIATGSAWRYLDDGSRYEDGWTDPAFDDFGWSTGAGPFGFGDGRESTTLGDGHIGYRFRHRFELNLDAGAGARITGAQLDLVADDGAVVFVNGVEVARYNLPPDQTITRWTNAIEAVWGDDELAVQRFEIDPSLLNNGTNTVAVAVQNLWSGSGDLGFDLELAVDRTRPDPPPPGDQVGPVTLVADDDPWSFLDDGSGPGSDWADADFDDGRWSTGIGRFGFGDGDEVTELQPGSASYYFRTGFTVASIPDQLTLDARFDDGMAVYLNGQEVARRNLPVGPVSWWTTAIQARWGEDEQTVETISIDPSRLVVGANVLAVSVHNTWTGNADLSFDAVLTGVWPDDGDDQQPPGPEPDPGAPWQPTTLIGTDAQWRFNDQGVDLGQTWRTGDYDHSGWRLGPALLGFGDGDEATTVAKWHKTYYFRHRFDVDPGPGLMPDELVVRLLVDDGAAVYLNGSEIVRQNLPAGQLVFDSAPPTPVWGDQERSYTRYRLPADLLVDGTNTVAVEAHNYSAGNSDLSFGFELIAE